MAEKRLVRNLGVDLVRYHAHEDGTNYRGLIQDMDPVMQHVQDMNEKVNEVCNSRNVNGWKYGGSIPWALLIDWLCEAGYRMDQFARSKELRKEFITWMNKPERRGFIADAGHLKQSRRG